MLINIANLNIVVSIRAPAWGATQCFQQPCLGVRFQFALPHGERRARIDTPQTGNGFQFALPHGERLGVFGVRRKRGGFQFALPHGERLVGFMRG